jgi:hypothetical protein
MDIEDVGISDNNNDIICKKNVKIPTLIVHFAIVFQLQKPND